MKKTNEDLAIITYGLIVFTLIIFLITNMPLMVIAATRPSSVQQTNTITTVTGVERLASGDIVLDITCANNVLADKCVYLYINDAQIYFPGYLRLENGKFKPLNWLDTNQ